MNFCPACGKSLSGYGKFCSGCGAGVGSFPRVEGLGKTPGPGAAAGDHTLRRIADYERISGILWLVLGVMQVLMVVTIIVGVWNIVAAVSRLNMRPMILARDARVPVAYEGVTQLIVIGVLNLLLGGVIGVLFVAFDFIIRDMVLSNRHLFDHEGNGVEI